MGNLALSIIAAAVLVGGYVAIQSKDIKAKNTLIQTKSALAYENSIKKENTTDYAKLNVKPSMLFITDNTNEKILLGKLSDAVEKLVKINPNKNNFNCNELASTGKITYSECEKIYSKKFTVITPTNTAVENSITTDINALKGDKTQNKIIISTVASEIAPNSKTEKEIVQIAQNQEVKTIQNPVVQEVKVNKVIKQMKKYHITNMDEVSDNTKVYKVMNNIMKASQMKDSDDNTNNIISSQIKTFIPNADTALISDDNTNDNKFDNDKDKFDKFNSFSNKNNTKKVKTYISPFGIFQYY